MKLSIASLLEEVSPQSLLFEMLYSYGFQSSQIADIYYSLFTQSGKCFFSGTHRLLRDRDNLYLEPISHNDDILPELSYELVEITPDFILPRDKETACLDADKVTIPLTIRKWERGDKFYPLGMKGKKNISDYLTDKKFTLFEKERQYVACKDDDIVWLVEERIDHRFRITSSSKLALIIRIKRAE
jgi:tRNA(Ile)-lysidine synthase